MSEPVTPQVGDPAPDMTLPDQDQCPVQLARLWEKQTTALVFLRHFGCMHCRAHAVQLRRDRHKFTRAGLRVALIGLGTPEQARTFRDEFDLPFTILADPQKAAYQAYGLTFRMNLVKEAVSPEEIAKTLARTARYGLAFTDQDIFQIGGDFVIDDTGMVRFAHRALRVADHPTTLALLGAVRPSASLGA